MMPRILLPMAAAACFTLAAAQTAAPPAAQPGPPTGAPTANPPGKPSTGEEPVQPTQGDDRETIEASTKWLALLDAGKFGVAWDVSSAHLKSVVTRPVWIAGITEARKPFGTLKTRTAAKFARAHSMPDAPDGDYSIIEFDSEFAGGKHAQEQIVWTLEKGDVWRVSGYFIR